jgi:hypothetical protein
VCDITFKNIIVLVKRDKSIRAGKFKMFVDATQFFEFAAKCHSNGVLNSRINGTGTCKILNLVLGDGKAVAEKLLFVISFMQGIYTYIPETIHVCSSVAAVL